MKKNISLILLFLMFIGGEVMAGNINSKNNYPVIEAEKYITKILDRKLPYSKDILGITWVIKSNDTYPPGRLTEIFASYLLDNDLIKDKKVADVGSSGFAIGVIAAKHGAKEVVGTSITKESFYNANDNIAGNNVANIAHVSDGFGVEPLLPKYKGKIDVVIFGPPWDTISTDDFKKIPEYRKALVSLFYDVDDKLTTNVLSKAPLLLNSNGKIFMTASLRTMDKMKSLFQTSGLDYKIVKQEDIHKDGNIHYILMLTPMKN